METLPGSSSVSYVQDLINAVTESILSLSRSDINTYAENAAASSEKVFGPGSFMSKYLMTSANAIADRWGERTVKYLTSLIKGGRYATIFFAIAASCTSEPPKHLEALKLFVEFSTAENKHRRNRHLGMIKALQPVHLEDREKFLENIRRAVHEFRKEISTVLRPIANMESGAAVVDAAVRFSLANLCYDGGELNTIGKIGASRSENWETDLNSALGLGVGERFDATDVQERISRMIKEKYSGSLELYKNSNFYQYFDEAILLIYKSDALLKLRQAFGDPGILFDFVMLFNHPYATNLQYKEEYTALSARMNTDSVLKTTLELIPQVSYRMVNI